MDQLALGARVGAAVGWRFGAVPLVLGGRLDFTRHAPDDLTRYFGAEPRRFRHGSGTGIVDVAFAARYWPAPWLYADGALGATETSVIRIRNTDPGRVSPTTAGPGIRARRVATSPRTPACSSTSAPGSPSAA